MTDDVFFKRTVGKCQPITFLNDLNTKHNSKTFDYKILQSSVPFLGTEVYYKTMNCTIHTKIYKEETDRQSFFHTNSEQLISLKNSIPYSQLLRVKFRCPTTENFQLFLELKQKFIKKGCKSDLLDETYQQLKN